MAKKSIIARELKRERIVAKYAEKRQKLKEEGNYEELDKLPRNSNPIRLRNRCGLTGRPRGYMRRFGLCRNQFRDLALFGMIPGVTKASW
jgi:small subunit ribosomal protein S14